MKKKPKPKPKPMTTRVKLLEAQTALTDLRTYEHADELKRIGGRFDKLANSAVADFQTHTRRIDELNESVNQRLLGMLSEINRVENLDAEYEKKTAEAFKALKPWMEDQHRCVFLHAEEIDAIHARLAALEYLSGIRKPATTEPTPGWVTYGAVFTPKPSLWQKFKRFLGF